LKARDLGEEESRTKEESISWCLWSLHPHARPPSFKGTRSARDNQKRFDETVPDSTFPDDEALSDLFLESGEKALLGETRGLSGFKFLSDVTIPLVHDVGAAL
jgi:hypothetical protein